MPTKANAESNELVASGARSEPEGRAQRPAGGASLEIPDAVRDRLSDEVIDELLAGTRSAITRIRSCRSRATATNLAPVAGGRALAQEMDNVPRG